MTAWAVLTLEIQENDYGRKEAPTRLLIDSGIDEQGWIDDDTYYTLSFGRFQDARLHHLLEDMHSPIFSGVHIAHLAHVENTGDNIGIMVYRPKQRNSDSRVDGYEEVEIHEGDLWPEEDKVDFQDRIEEIYNLRPVIEPQNETVPPDMLVRR